MTVLFFIFIFLRIMNNLVGIIKQYLNGTNWLFGVHDANMIMDISGFIVEYPIDHLLRLNH